MEGFEPIDSSFKSHTLTGLSYTSIRTQIATPTGCKHRYLQERRDMKNLLDIKGSHLMVVKHHQNRYKSISDVLLYTVITTGNISNTDLCLRPYRSGRDYCSEFNYLLYKGGLIDIATMKVKFYLYISIHNKKNGSSVLKPSKIKAYSYLT